MEEQIRIPEIRFRGFNKEWNHSVLGDLLRKPVTDGPHETPKLLDVGVPFISVEAIHDGIIDLSKRRGCISESDNEKYSRKYKPEIDDILITKAATIGRVAMIEDECNFNVWSPIGAIKVNPIYIIPRFLLYHLQLDSIQQDAINASNNGSQLNLGMKKIEGFKINYPVYLKEQRNISDFFKSIDSLITNSQKKYKKLQNIKKALLEKMFPKNGENVPEIRFKGFTDDWEKMSFKDIFSFLQSNSLSREKLNFEKGEAYNIHYGDILIKFGECLDTNQYSIPMVDDNEIVLKYQSSLIENGDIIFADAAEDETVGKCCEILGLTGEKMLSGLHTIPCRPNIKFAKGFLGYFLNSDTYHDQLLPLMQGTKVSSISKTALTKTSICFPKNVDEQKKIGSYFIKLDNTIRLHKEKHDRLLNIKKALLEKMFV